MPRRSARPEKKTSRLAIPGVRKARRMRRQLAARTVFRRFIRVLEKLQQREKETGHADA